MLHGVDMLFLGTFNITDLMYHFHFHSLAERGQFNGYVHSYYVGNALGDK